MCRSLRVTSPARHVVIVEKEAVFRMLCEAQIWDQFPIILATGQGMPDMATREMLSHIIASCTGPVATTEAFSASDASDRVEMAVLGLVDWNPSGCYILCNYKFGNKKGSRLSTECGFPCIEGGPCRRQACEDAEPVQVVWAT